MYSTLIIIQVLTLTVGIFHNKRFMLEIFDIYINLYFNSLVFLLINIQTTSPI